MNQEVRVINRSINILGLLMLTLHGVANAASLASPTVTAPLQKQTLNLAPVLAVSWSAPAQAAGEDIATTFDLFVRDGESKEIHWRNETIPRDSSCDANDNCSLLIPISLPEAKNHFLRIRAISATAQSAWSDVRHFTVIDPNRQAPDLPLLLTPTKNSAVDLGSPIEVSWQLAADANPLRDPTAYDFFVYDRQSESVLTRELNVSGISCDPSRVCTYQLANQLPEAKNHFIRMRARNLAGASVWSPVRRFSVVNADRKNPDMPTITAPMQWQTFASSEALNFSWTAAEDPSSLNTPIEFDAFVYNPVSKIFLWRDHHVLADTHCDNSGACNITVPVSVPEAEGYVFRVKSKNATGDSAWSKSARFSIYHHQALELADSCTAAIDSAVFYSDSISHLVSGGTAPYTFEVVSNAARGTVDLDYNSGSFVYYASDNGRGYLEEFDVKVRDQNGEESTATISFVYGTRRIMPVGDSITFGVLNYNSTTKDFPLSANAVGYRKHLKELLQAGGYATEFVGPRSSGTSAGLSDSRHAGYPGWTSLHIANGRSGYASSGHLTQWLDNHAADVLLIHAGTNDHSSDTYGVGRILAKAQTWRANNNLPLVSMTATLVDQRRDYWNRSNLDLFNAAMPWEVATVSNARLVDMFPVLDWRDDLTTYPTDITGLHPNAGGYIKMAEKWYQSLVDEGEVSKCE